MELKDIVNVCKENECINCPFYLEELCECSFEHIPQAWDIEGIERRYYNYGKKEN